MVLRVDWEGRGLTGGFKMREPKGRKSNRCTGSGEANLCLVDFLIRGGRFAEVDDAC